MGRPPDKPTISHPFWGRLVGVLWDVSIALATTLAFPAYALRASCRLVAFSPLYTPLVMPLLLLALCSFVFGVMWSFRRFIHGGEDDAA